VAEVENTKDNYRDDLRLHVRPFSEHFTLGEITTGRQFQWPRVTSSRSRGLSGLDRSPGNACATWS